MRQAWEFRVNNIRQSGDVFASYDDATSRLFQELNRLHFGAVSEEERAYNGQREGQAIAEVSRAKRERPLADLTFKCLRNGKPWVLQVNRLPWGSSPSGQRKGA